MSDEVEVVICSICRQVADHPELRGTMWFKPPNGTPISFSATVVQLAGGIDRLLSEWQQDKWEPAKK